MTTSTAEELRSRHLCAKGVCCRHGKVEVVHKEQELELEE